ncbi:MAG: hypothetical protein AAF750_07385 [Planctomycetota bacterium]
MDPIPEAAPLESEAAAPALHSIKGILCAAFLGSFLGGGIVMAINFARMKKQAAAVGTVIASVVATLGLVGLIFALPDDLPVPNIAFIVPQLLAVYFIAKALQGQAIAEHTEAGGAMSSQWRSAGVGLLCFVVLAVGIFAAVFALEPSFGTRVEFGNDEVYIAGDATGADAQKLADALETAGYFGSAGASVKLEELSGQTTISFVLVDGAWNAPDTLDGFRELGGLVAESGFAKPLTVELCNAYFEVQKTLTIE